MQYQQISSGSQYPYPNHDIDPDKKGREWCMHYAMAAYYDWQFVYPKGIFSGNGGDYSKFRLYAKKLYDNFVLAFLFKSFALF